MLHGQPYRTPLVDHVDELRAVVKGVKQRHLFHINAVVVLPDHLHALWTLPQDDVDFATLAGMTRDESRSWGSQTHPNLRATG